ncbi:MAG TPA: MBL fold metallo-hydrolase [Candidatus Paceibacterota bacterium]|jgi:L-ascorbate metabolism protein UlaG (beta-lactamase superfamily)|nr:MBL fold metallo-hydrolase [Candidatus Paceibacterota bacterium]
MKITKLGHCALILEVESPTGGTLRILTDPGSFTIEQNVQTEIDIILITHEHGDHFHIDSLRELLVKNPKAAVITNQAVAAIIQKEGIGAVVSIVGDGQAMDANGVRIEGFGRLHAEIYKEVGRVENTGYMVANKFYFPGDAFHNPGKPVDILALPAGGPWMKASESIDFCLEVKPRVAFPVHDGMIRPELRAFLSYGMSKGFLEAAGIQFVPLPAGESQDF